MEPRERRRARPLPGWFGRPTAPSPLLVEAGARPGRKERVERVTAELGYAPRGGPGPERGAGSVNLVVGETNNAYFTEIIRNVEQTLERAGLSMVLTDGDARRSETPLALWMARVVEHGRTARSWRSLTST